jgi:hypothetical protein
LKSAGYSHSDILSSGYSASDLKIAGYTASDLKTAGYSASELQTAGYSISDLKNASYRDSYILSAGYTTSILYSSSNPSVATVDESGNVTILSVGTTITITLTQIETIYASAINTTIINIINSIDNPLILTSENILDFIFCQQTYWYANLNFYN